MASTAAIHRPLAFQMKCSEPNGRALRVRIPVSFLYIHSKRPPNALAIPKPVLLLPPRTELRPAQVLDVFNYPRNIDEKYKPVSRLGTGSFGIVSKVVERETGHEYACKSIAKVQRGKNVTTPRYLLKIQNEVECMYQLGASLDAVCLKGVFEDDEYIHIIMELCTGGPLTQAITRGQLTEERLAQIMRSVLRFVSQCHIKHLVYRDINHVNFLFSDPSPDAHLKATDFGLAMHYRPGDPSLTSRAGTPVYMAPEVIQRNYTNKADIWSAGILFYLLLTGRYPFFETDQIPAETTITKLFEVIVEQDIDFGELEAEQLPEGALDLLRLMLEKDPDERITAADALEHSWIREGGGACCSAPLGCSVIQRMQRFAVNGHLKQYVLNLIVDDIIDGNMGSDQLEEEERVRLIEPLVDLFSRVDTGNTGEILREDLMRELQDEGYSISKEEIEKLVSRLDVNQDGHILFDEFASSLLDWQHFQNRRNWKVLVRHAFDQIDVDKDGFISFTDVLEGLTNPFASQVERETEARLMLHECDTNGDGKICWDEFYAMLLDTSTTALSSLACYDRRYVEEACVVSDKVDNETTTSRLDEV